MTRRSSRRCSAPASRRLPESRSTSLSDVRRPRRPRKAGTSLPSPAALGVVKVGADFTVEYPDGDPIAAEVLATLVRTGDAINHEIDRTMLASWGVASRCSTPRRDRRRRRDVDADAGQRADALLIGDDDEHARCPRVPRLGSPGAQPRRSAQRPLEITDEGRAVANRFLPGIRVLERAVLAELTRSDRVTLLRLLGKVLAGAAAVAEADPIPLEGRRNRPAGLV